MLELHNLHHIKYYAKFLFLLHTDHVHYQYFHPVEDRPTGPKEAKRWKTILGKLNDTREGYIELDSQSQTYLLPAPAKCHQRTIQTISN